MKSQDYVTEALITALRALNTMEGLIVEAQDPIPSDVLENEGPTDANNDENLLVTFGELEGLRELTRDIVAGVVRLYSDDPGETSAELLDTIGEHETNMNRLISEILEKYKGDTITDEF